MKAMVMGMPVKDFPNPPDDQPGCELDNCKICNKRMWVSLKKRNLVESGIAEILCAYCVVYLEQQNDIKSQLIDMRVIDL